MDVPKLTDLRFQKAKSILDRYQQELLRTGDLDFTAFERELKDVWNLGYQGLKPIIIELAARGEYTALAARYMEHGWPAVVSEFKPPLAKLYGVRHFADERRDKGRRKFWEKMKLQKGAE
jgi:hypothetical protein